MPRINNDTTEFILQKMFSMIGKEYDPDLTRMEGWYSEYTWTSEQQHEFTYWLRDFLRNKYHIPKKKANNEAAWFVLHCGWRLDSDRKETKTEQEEETQPST